MKLLAFVYWFIVYVLCLWQGVNTFVYIYIYHTRVNVCDMTTLARVNPVNETEMLHKCDVLSCFQVGSDSQVHANKTNVFDKVNKQLSLQPGFSIDDELQQRPRLLVAQTSKMNCKHFFTDSGTYHLFLSVLHGYFFMTFINITFGYQFTTMAQNGPNLHSSVLRRLDRSTWTTWNASRVQRAQCLLWLHQSTCRVKKIGEMIFAIVFLDLFFGRFWSFFAN